jgi:hypothetical protein
MIQDNYYDFNYQQSRTLKEEITILPGDELLTECEYDTSEMNRIVLVISLSIDMRLIRLSDAVGLILFTEFSSLFDDPWLGRACH